MAYTDYDSRMLAALEAATGQTDAGSGPFQDYDSRIQALLAYLAANGAGLTQFDTIAAIETFTPQTAPAAIYVRGRAGAADGGEGFFALVESEPAALTNGSDFHRRQDASGNWYERTFSGEVRSQIAGVLGNAVDCTDALNDLIEWVGFKGGGTIVLPPGPVVTAGQVLINSSSIHLRGSCVGDTDNEFGTTWGMSMTTADTPKVVIGNNTTEIVRVTISDMKITVGSSNEWCFRSKKVRALTFENIQCNIISGFLAAGTTDGVDGETANCTTIGLTLNNVKTGFAATSTKGFLLLQNVQAPLLGDTCHVEGNVNFTEGGGQFAVKIPVGGERTDGAIFTGFNVHYWDVGFDLRGGFANWQVSNSYLDGCFSRAFDLRTEDEGNGLTATAVHMAGRGLSNPDADADIAVDIGPTGGGTCRNIDFADSRIFNWGRGAFNVQGGEAIKITDNLLQNVCTDADNTYDAITLGASLGDDCDISGNTIRNENETNNPRYGIEVAATTAKLRVVGNTISDCQTGTLNNPNRGSAQTRKIYGNSGQVLEGTTNHFGPWVQVDTPASSSQVMEFDALAQVTKIIAVARGRIVGYWGRVGLNPSAGTCVVRPIIVSTQQAATPAMQNGTISVRTNSPSGLEFNAGDELGFNVTTNADWAATTNEVAAGMVVYYD